MKEMEELWGNEIDKITDNLYLGSIYGAKKVLKEGLADFVISIITEDDLISADFEDFHTFNPHGKSRLYLPIDDAQDTDLLIHLEGVTALMDKTISDGKIIYVHCFAGISRSPSFVIGYLIKYKDMSFSSALNYVGERREIIWPNPRFIRDLKEWERKCRE